MLNQQGDVHGQAGQGLDPQFQAAERTDGLFPLVLTLAFGVVDLDRIEATQGFDQARLALGSQRHGAFQGLGQGLLQEMPDAQRQRERNDRNPHQVPAQQGNDQQDEDGERQVDQAGQGQRREEVAHALEFVDVLRVAAHARRTVFHRHADDALEQRGRDDQVGLLAGQVQAQAAQPLEQQVEQVGTADAHRQHPQGRGGLVGHDAVVDVHHEQGRGQGDDIDHQAGGDGVGVQPARTLEGVAEPGMGTRDQRAVGDVELVLRLSEKHPAGEVLRQRFARHTYFTAIAFAEQQPRGIAFPTQQHGAARVLEHQHGRQGYGRNLIQLALQYTALQTGACSGARQQVCGQTLRGQRQAGGQHGPAGGLVMQRTQRQQAVEQRVIVLAAWVLAE